MLALLCRLQGRRARMAEVMELWMVLVWERPLIPALTWEYGGTPTNTGTAKRTELELGLQ